MTQLKTANEIVSLARSTSRLTAREWIHGLCGDSFMECHGDRYYGDDGAIVGGVGLMDNQPVTIIGVQKGRDLGENIKTNFGSPSPEGYRKALRLMKQAEKFNRPILLFVNTPGAFCGIEAEERGEGEAIASNLYEMSDLTVPIISFLTGEGGSGGALALALADEVWMLENSIYSILSPEGFATILWKDSSRAEEAATLMKLTAPELLDLRVIDGIIKESDDIGELSQTSLIHSVKQQVNVSLHKLQQMTPTELVTTRYQRFRQF